MRNPFHHPPLPRPEVWLGNTDDGKLYAKMVAGLRSATVEFARDSEHCETTEVKAVTNDTPLPESNAVGSESVTDNGYHKVVLDIDHEAMLVPSSTPGHYHLYIDKLVPWKQYLELMKSLAAAGIIQKNYMFASEKRGGSWVRTPWTRKK